MPTYKDEKGETKFRMNPQVGKAQFGSKSEGGSPMGEKKPSMGGSEHGSESGSSVTLHSHGDGTYHTEHEGGEHVEHPHLGHALMHMAHHNEPGGKHVHVHSEGGTHTSHSIDENGEHQGPHDHQNLEELKNHFDQFLDEEGQEKGGAGYGSSESREQSGDQNLGHLME